MRRVTIVLVKRALNRLTSIGVIFLFIFGVWCATMTAPALTAGSPMPACMQDGSMLETGDCDSFAFSCEFVYPCGLLFKGAFTARTYSFARDMQSLTIGVVSPAPPGEISPACAGPGAVSVAGVLRKVPIHVFNSVLTL